VSFLLAVLLTAILAYAATHAHPPNATVPEVAPPTTMVVLERAPPTPRPTPRPTPEPTPRPTQPPTAPPTHAAVVQRAAPPAQHASGGASRAPTPTPHITVARHPAVHTPARALAVADATGTGMGPGVANGEGPGNGGGAGNGTGGDGSGPANTDAPCGYVEFIPYESPQIEGTTSYEHIRATVHYPDGHTEFADFPYPWIYADAEVNDPWSISNMRHPGNGDARAQLPPPGANVSRYPDVIRYVLEHTTPSGVTVLQECPKAR
jgi:hypothetical protein